MADRSTFSVVGVKSDMQLLTAKLTGNTTNDMVNAESATLGGGEVSAAARTGAGTFNLTFRKRYAQLMCPLKPMTIGTTAGLTGRFTAFDPQAKTATLVLEVGAVATDPATTDTVYLAWIVRNSSRNT